MSNDKTIIEGNLLIAQFNGWTYADLEDCKRDTTFGVLHNYNEDWNKLMPVVEKIEAIRDEYYGWFQVFIHSNACTIQSKYSHRDDELPSYISDPNAILNTKIESTWYNIVQFIQWYNQQKQSS